MPQNFPIKFGILLDPTKNGSHLNHPSKLPMDYESVNPWKNEDFIPNKIPDKQPDLHGARQPGLSLFCRVLGRGCACGTLRIPLKKLGNLRQDEGNHHPPLKNPITVASRPQRRMVSRSSWVVPLPLSPFVRFSCPTSRERREQLPSPRTSSVCFNGWFHLPINGIYWGYNPLILTLDPNFLGHLSMVSTWRSMVILLMEEIPNNHLGCKRTL